MSDKRAARAWAHHVDLPSMLRCQAVWVHLENPALFALCALLPDHQGPCRHITPGGTVRAIDDWWVRA